MSKAFNLPYLNYEFVSAAISSAILSDDMPDTLSAKALLLEENISHVVQTILNNNPVDGFSPDEAQQIREAFQARLFEVCTDALKFLHYFGNKKFNRTKVKDFQNNNFSKNIIALYLYQLPSYIDSSSGCSTIIEIREIADILEEHLTNSEAHNEKLFILTLLNVIRRSSSYQSDDEALRSFANTAAYNQLFNQIREEYESNNPPLTGLYNYLDESLLCTLLDNIDEDDFNILLETDPEELQNETIENDFVQTLLSTPANKKRLLNCLKMYEIYYEKSMYWDFDTIRQKITSNYNSPYLSVPLDNMYSTNELFAGGFEKLPEIIEKDLGYTVSYDFKENYDSLLSYLLQETIDEPLNELPDIISEEGAFNALISLLDEDKGSFDYYVQNSPFLKKALKDQIQSGNWDAAWIQYAVNYFSTHTHDPKKKVSFIQNYRDFREVDEKLWESLQQSTLRTIANTKATPRKWVSNNVLSSILD